MPESTIPPVGSVFHLRDPDTGVVRKYVVAPEPEVSSPPVAEDAPPARDFRGLPLTLVNAKSGEEFPLDVPHFYVALVLAFAEGWRPAGTDFEHPNKPGSYFGSGARIEGGDATRLANSLKKAVAKFDPACRAEINSVEIVISETRIVPGGRSSGPMKAPPWGMLWCLDYRDDFMRELVEFLAQGACRVVGETL